MWFKFLGILLLALANIGAAAQEGRLKIGMGAHYVSNNYAADHLYDYGALSVNTAYTLWQQSHFREDWEQQAVLRNREDEDARKVAFIAAAPLVFRFQAGRRAVYAGAGPAWLYQRYRSYATDQKVNGLQVQALAGIAIRNRSVIGFQTPEWHVRAGVFKSLNSSNAAPHLSVLLLLGTRK